MNGAFYIDNTLVRNVDTFEEWLRDKQGLDHIDIAAVRQFYDDKLEATEWKESYREMEANAQLYEDHVWSIRNEVMDMVDDMRKRLKGKQSQEELKQIYLLLEEI